MGMCEGWWLLWSIFYRYTNHDFHKLPRVTLTTVMSTFCHRLYANYIWQPFFFWWGRIGSTCCHDIIYSYCIKKWNLRTINSMKITAKRTILNRSLNWLNLKTSQKLPSTSDSHKSLILSQNLEFNHLSESLESPLPLWYFEFPHFSHGIRLKPQIIQASSICPETEISATPTTFRDHYYWTICRMRMC
jgi:hypothetical protein